MDDPSAHVLEYSSYWLSMSFVFTLKSFWVWVSLCLVVDMIIKMVHWRLLMLPFSHSFKNWVIPFRYESALYYISNIIWCWRFLMMYLSLRAVMICTLFIFPVSFWLDMDYRNWRADVGSFLPMLRIQTFVLSLSGNAWFHGMLFFYWEMYDMLWCSQYCVMISIGAPLGEK